MAGRHVLRALDIDLVTTVPCEVGCADDSGGYTRSEEFPVPVAMVSINDYARTLATEHLAYAFPDSLIGLPITTRRKRVAVFPVIVVIIRVPRAGAHALDEGRTYPVSFDRQRMVGVGNIAVFNGLHIGIDVADCPRCGGEHLHHRLPHLLPHQANAVNVRRLFAHG